MPEPLKALQPTLCGQEDPSEARAWVGAGNLAADPFQAPNGGPCVLKVAINRSYLRDGQREEVADYIPVEVWGRRGEALATMLRKGESVTVTGYLCVKARGEGSTRTWETKVVATNVVLRGKKARGD